MNSFSKTISPALRTGYMVLPKPLADRYRSRLHFMSCTVPTYIQYVIADLIDSGDFERHINRVRRSKRKQLKVNET
jgi:GntR family transcriptional regulator/MocR family aminotransferase